MTFAEKIDEWIKEAETRPGSALMILKLVAGRLRDLTEGNEELLAENISLQDGSRVDEYQKRIAYLEFQLELLKRRFGSGEAILPEANTESMEYDLLVYNAQGRMLRMRIGAAEPSGKASLGQLSGELAAGGELPRFLAVHSLDEVLFLFSSGRISTRPVAGISLAESGAIWSWEQAAMPDEPHAGEMLVCVMPLARLPVSEFILQASRRGCVKKTTRSIAEKVLSSHYLGRGAIQKSDQPFDVVLCEKKSRYVLVTYEGRLLGLDVDGLSFAAEERIRLSTLDHVVAAFVLAEGESILCLTQNGKVILRESAGMEMAKSNAARGQALIPPARLEQGTRFIGAVPYRVEDSLVVLDGQGCLNVYPVSEVCGAGVIHAGSVCVSVGRIPAMGRQVSQL